MEDNRIVFLLSGGLDSLVLGELALEEGFEPIALTFSYGQPAQTQEILKARQWCRKRGVRHETRVISLEGMGAMNKEAGEKGPRIVPARNLVMVAHAANLAKAEGARQVWYGATKEDAEYPDCSCDFVDRLSFILEETEGLRLVTPFIIEDRESVVERARGFGLSPEDVWSCYAPTGDLKRTPCGECNSCLQRGL